MTTAGLVFAHHLGKLIVGGAGHPDLLAIFGATVGVGVHGGVLRGSGVLTVVPGLEGSALQDIPLQS
jgi:hypothetical protein